MVRSFMNYKKLPYNAKLKDRAKELRKAGNKAVIVFWQHIKSGKFLELDFDRQKIIGNYIVDFYCSTLNLVVEIDGASHNGKYEYDEVRDAYLKGLGLIVIHYNDNEVLKSIPKVLDHLKEIVFQQLGNK